MDFFVLFRFYVPYKEIFSSERLMDDVAQRQKFEGRLFIVDRMEDIVACV